MIFAPHRAVKRANFAVVVDAGFTMGAMNVGSDLSVAKRRRSCRGRGRGFSLLETLVALAVLGLALVSTITLLTGHHAADRRIDGHLRALQVLEAEHEALRGGLPLPLEEGSHSLVPIVSPGEPLRDVSLTAEVKPLEPSGLYSVKLICRYRVDRGGFSRTLEIRLWRP